MLTIVYASRAVREMDGQDLSALLENARAHNGPDDITGMLLYSQSSFLQQLEGDDAAVDATFERISADDRHTDVRVLSRRTITTRRFPAWSMGFEHPDAAALARRLSGYSPPGNAPFVSSELVEDAEVAEALLALYAVGPFTDF